MPSPPASQPADDGEAVGAETPTTADPSSGEPLPHRDGARRTLADYPPRVEANDNDI
jgi:hypothetical protein